MYMCILSQGRIQEFGKGGGGGGGGAQLEAPPREGTGGGHPSRPAIGGYGGSPTQVFAAIYFVDSRFITRKITYSLSNVLGNQSQET